MGHPCPAIAQAFTALRTYDWGGTLVYPNILELLITVMYISKLGLICNVGINVTDFDSKPWMNLFLSKIDITIEPSTLRSWILNNLVPWNPCVLSDSYQGVGYSTPHYILNIIYRRRYFLICNGSKIQKYVFEWGGSMCSKGSSQFQPTVHLLFNMNEWEGPGGIY